MNLLTSLLFCLIFSVNQLLALTPKERKEFLDIHNYLRRSVVPSSSDMQELEYDEKIERSVNEHLDQCKFVHRRLDGYGENGRLASDNNITNTVMSWFQERVYFNISAKGDQRCSKENSKVEYINDIQCGHYKMMVKGTLKSLGCGYKFCKNIQGSSEDYKDFYITFCFYNSGQKDQPYEIGKVCSDCNEEYQFCNDDLCVPKDRYNKNSRTCKLKCKNCGEYFDPKNSCLCDCPDGTEGNSCRGTPLFVDNSCTPCNALGLSCINGIEDLSSDKCSCKCTSEYQGEYCEIRKDQFAASYYHTIDGVYWRHNMMMPVNILEFKKSFFKLQNVVAQDINEFCLKNQDTNIDCKPIVKNPVTSNNVFLISGFPSMLENGSLAFRMFANFSVISNGVKQEIFIPSSILRQIWLSKSEELERIIDNLRRINPIDMEQIYQNPSLFMDPNIDISASNASSQSYQHFTNKQNSENMESTDVPTSLFATPKTSENKILKTEISTININNQSPIFDASTKDKIISTTSNKYNTIIWNSSVKNRATESSINTRSLETIYTTTSSPQYITTTSNGEHNSTSTSEKAFTKNHVSFISTVELSSPNNNKESTLTTQFINLTTASTSNFIPTTTEKCANINREIRKSFIFISILYICLI